MRLLHLNPTLTAGLLTCLCSLSLSSLAVAGETAVPPAETNVAPALNAALEGALRQLKDQQASTFQALELIRGHTETALLHNAATVSNQLAQLSTALASHSDQQLQLMRSAEGRTLRVTMLILLVVLLAAAALLLLAVRTLRGLVQRIPPHGAESNAESVASLASPAASLLEHAVDSAYTSALLEVEKRIAALEHKQPVSTGSKAAPATAPRPATSPKARPNPSLALALGQGEALMFLPREQTSGVGRVFTIFGRIGRLFRRESARSQSHVGVRR
jgi:hypothetical protein